MNENELAQDQRGRIDGTLSVAGDKFNAVPARACMFEAGDLEIGDNGSESQSAPIRLLARSSRPIEHWYWGRVVHDINGMTLHKPRLPIDYIHDDNQIIGYLNRFEEKPEGLFTSGALTPWKESDRAAEIIAKLRLGVPYEASINFGGDGIEIEEVEEGHSVMVNGYLFEGPGIVIRKWPLRGVAICPYGADAHTETVEGASLKQFSVVKLKAKKIETQVQEEKTNMNANEKAVEATAAEAAPAAVDAPVTVAEAVETVVVDVHALTQTEAPEMPEAEQSFKVDELQRMIDEFGLELAVETVLNGGDYEAAHDLHYEALRREVEQLKARAEADKGEAQPVQFTAADNDKAEKAAQVEAMTKRGLTPAQAAFAADSKLTRKK